MGRETERKERMDIHFMSEDLGEIFGILALQMCHVMQLPCSNLMVDNLLKFVFAGTQVDVSVTECWLGWWEREIRQRYSLWMI